MEIIREDIETLRGLAEKLELRRKESPTVNDMFEAAADWKNLGELLVENSGRTNFPGRVQQEVELFQRLQSRYGEAFLSTPDYAAIMRAGWRLIVEGKQRKLDPDGFLGALKVIRLTFAFLQSDFGFKLVRELITEADYLSDRVRVKLDLATEHSSWCSITNIAFPDRDFELEDLLFMHGRSVSLALPPGQEITTQAEVQAWFNTVADILRQYGSDVLADRPGAFDRLAAAAAERQRLIIEECERLYFEEHGRPYGSDTTSGSDTG